MQDCRIPVPVLSFSWLNPVSVAVDSCQGHLRYAGHWDGSQARRKQGEPCDK